MSKTRPTSIDGWIRAGTNRPENLCFRFLNNALAFADAGTKAHDGGREVVGDPVLGAAQIVNGGDAGLFGELASRSGLVVLAGIDAALRPLPAAAVGDVGAAADPGQALGIEEDHADVGPMSGKGVVAGHVARRTPERAAMDEAGASWMPRSFRP